MEEDIIIVGNYFGRLCDLWNVLSWISALQLTLSNFIPKAREMLI